jgi:hypothetical protein
MIEKIFSVLFFPLLFRHYSRKLHGNPLKRRSIFLTRNGKEFSASEEALAVD